MSLSVKITQRVAMHLYVGRVRPKPYANVCANSYAFSLATVQNALTPDLKAMVASMI